MHEDFLKCVDILVNPDTDYKAIVIDIMKYRPEVVAYVCSTHKTVDDFIRGGFKIKAIKAWRDIYGCSLVEARDAVCKRTKELENENQSRSTE